MTCSNELRPLYLTIFIFVVVVNFYYKLIFIIVVDYNCLLVTAIMVF